jgi:hypothetical protein
MKIAWWSLSVTACLPERPTLSVKELTVREEVDESGLLELEVHAFDADFGRFLGCAAITEADYSGVRYRVASPFLKSPELPRDDRSPSKLLVDLDLVGRNLVFVVTERDDAACNAPYQAGEDIVGISDVVPARALPPSIPWRFDRVVSLIVGFDDEP